MNTGRERTRTYYIAYTSIGYWTFTTPRSTPAKAVQAAENQVSTTILKSLSIPFPTQGFGDWLRTNHCDILARSHDFIGEVRSVILLNGETPRQFRRRYCSISFEEEFQLTGR